MTSPSTAILLMNLGGPERLEDVEPFLFNIFSDPDVVQFPWGSLGQRFIARRMARSRGPEARENYTKIGGGSPLLTLTRRQGELLVQTLGPGYRAYVAMRAWHPDTTDAVRQAIADGATRIVALPCYPQYSHSTTGSSLRELRRVVDGQLPIHVIEQYCDAPWYIAAWQENLGASIAANPKAHVLFSAHSLPKKMIDRGDPYLDQIQRTVHAVMEAFPGHPHSLSFQSRATRVEWLTPSTQDELRALASRGIRDLLVVPISFLTDHVETLFELDLQLRDFALEAGVERFTRVPSLNESPTLIRGLAELVRGALGKDGAR